MTKMKRHLEGNEGQLFQDKYAFEITLSLHRTEYIHIRLIP